MEENNNKQTKKKEEGKKENLQTSITPNTKKNVPKQDNNLIKVLRTYRNDVADTLNKRKISLTGMVISEQKKREKEGIVKEKKPKKKRSNLMILLFIIILLIISGGGFGYYYIINLDKTSTEITELKIPIFIFPNYQREIFLKNLKKTTVVSTVEKEKGGVSIPLGSIIQFFLTSEDTTKTFTVEQTEENKLLVTTEVFLNSLDTKVATSLVRALDPNFIFGFHSSLGNNPFLILKVKSYENVFAGMLNWEKTMVKELFPIFEKERSTIDVNNYNFKDIIIVNKDVRAILDSEGKIEFAYSFPDKETLIIVNNETTLKEIFRRLITAKLERKN